MNTTLSNATNQSNVPLEQFYVWGENCVNTQNINNVNMRRDPNIDNRFWLKFPETWRTSEQKERIVGVRNIWLNEANRIVLFGLLIFKKDSETPFSGYMVYFNVTTDTSLDTQFNDYFDSHNINIRCYSEIGNLNTPNYTLAFYYYPVDTVSRTYEIQIVEMTPETSYVLNHLDKDGRPLSSTSRANRLFFTNVWNRKSVMVTSSIATNTYKNEIGFSGTRYMPIKYFKINSNQTEFWIDLWIGHYMLAPAILPKDNKDGISLELIFLHDTDDSLYT